MENAIRPPSNLRLNFQYFQLEKRLKFNYYANTKYQKLESIEFGNYILIFQFLSDHRFYRHCRFMKHDELSINERELLRKWDFNRKNSTQFQLKSFCLTVCNNFGEHSAEIRAVYFCPK